MGIKNGPDLDLLARFIEHHGVKGMKWGVRRDRSARVTVSQKGKKLKTSGGHGLPPVKDAMKAAKIGQRGKASGLQAVSSKDLQTYAERLQLEQRVKGLEFNNKSPAGQFVSKLLGQQGQRHANQLAGDPVDNVKKAVGLAKTLKTARRAVKVAGVTAV